MMRREWNGMNSKSFSFFKRLAGHKIAIIALLLPFGAVIFLTAVNENFILQITEGSKESLITSWILLYLGIAVMIGTIVWIVLVLIARRSI